MNITTTAYDLNRRDSYPVRAQTNRRNTITDIDIIPDPQIFALIDPRTMDGNPYDVAGRSARQAASLAALYRAALDGMRLMARNAEMERNLGQGRDAGASEWEQGPQARIIDKMISEVAAHIRALELLARAVEYDPKHPPRA